MQSAKGRLAFRHWRSHGRMSSLLSDSISCGSTNNDSPFVRHGEDLVCSTTRVSVIEPSFTLLLSPPLSLSHLRLVLSAVVVLSSSFLLATFSHQCFLAYRPLTRSARLVRLHPAIRHTSRWSLCGCLLWLSSFLHRFPRASPFRVSNHCVDRSLLVFRFLVS